MTLRTFKEHLELKTAKRITPNKERARSLLEETNNRREFFTTMQQNIELTDKNANYFIETTYDILLTLIRSNMQADGYATSGEGAHEAEVAYLAVLDFSDKDVRFADQLRYFRNGILYYGKHFDAAYAKTVMEFLAKTYKPLYTKAEQKLK